MKQRILMAIALLTVVCSMALASGNANAYAVYTSEDKTITCYSDDLKNSRPGTILKLEFMGGTSGAGLALISSTIKNQAERVVFHPSFSDVIFTSGVQWFMGMKKMTTIEGLEYFDTSNLLDATLMFSGCSSLTTLDLSTKDMRRIKSACGMFQECTGLTTLKLFQSGPDITSTEYMFSNCASLTSLDLNNLNTGKVTKMEEMFANCKSLTTLDISCLDTHSVTTMHEMFSGCELLTRLNVNTFDTGNVTDMNSMFNDCKALVNIGESNMSIFNYISFDTHNVTTMQNMFANCESLSRLDLSGFDTGNVTTMQGMFYKCKNLADTFFHIVGFNTSNVTDMRYMFYKCSSLSLLRLYTFDTHRVTDMSDMFSGCSVLTAIYVGDGWSVANITNPNMTMFEDCNHLVGGAGTRYADIYNTDYYYARTVKYAHIDSSSNPGYLTYRTLGRYALYLGGTQVTELNQNNIPIAGGTAKYNNRYKTLTLRNAVIEAGQEVGILNGNGTSDCIDGLTIEVIGRCTVSSAASPMMLWGATTVKGPLADIVGDTLVLSGSHVTFVKSLTFNNRVTRQTSAVNNLLVGGSSSATLSFGEKATYMGTCHGTSVVNVYGMTFDGSTRLVGTEADDLMAYDASEHTVTYDGTPLAEVLLVGRYYPLWLGDTHISSAMAEYYNEMFGQFNIPVTISYDLAGTLVYRGNFHGLWGTGDTRCAYLTFMGDRLRIEMTADAYLTTYGDDTRIFNIQRGDVTVTGTGKLTAMSEYYEAVYLQATSATLTFRDIDLHISGKKGGIVGGGGPALYFDNVEGTVATTGTGIRDYCISGIGSMTVENCTCDGILNTGAVRKKSIAFSRPKPTPTALRDPAPQTTGTGRPQGWYTIDGRRLNGEPAAKGMYIHNGKIIVRR